MSEPNRPPKSLERKVRQILCDLLKNGSFLTGCLANRQRVLASVHEGGHHVALVLLPPKTKSSLSPRQNDVAGLVGYGLGNKGIAQRLGVSEDTVAGHLTHIYEKWGISTRAELARRAAMIELL